ncbi:amidohydrolase family protein [Pleionea sediminis]|uniref:amidohydrolase family protein n=1 Tax=Pleionea sediminis TaxID=2569479 RepID=UPI001187071F|nr:amidohydrolase family protein [Pleionea sediminis]
MKLFKMKTQLIAFAALSMSMFSLAHDLVPGKNAEHPIVIRHATLHTVSQGTLVNYDLLIKDGKIAEIADTITTDSKVREIDATGQHVYPGLIGLSSTLGLVEISAVRATRDQSEVGSMTPEVKAHIAFNADSELIPTVRSNGITHIEAAPTGGGLIGQSSVMHLDGWHWEDALVESSVGMHLRWPSTGINKSFWETRTPEKQREDNEKAFDSLHDTFEQIQSYVKARKNNKEQAVDVRWEAMRPVFEQKIPLFVHANDYRQIAQAIQFRDKFSLKIIIVGVYDAMKASKLIKDNNVPIVYSHTWGQPGRSDEAIDVAYNTPAFLENNNIPYALAIEGSWNIRDLPFAVGHTISYGVSKETALRSVTLEPAKLLGVDDVMGSLEKGKQANIVISKGDLFDHLTHKVTYMFIEGKEIDLNNRHKKLYEKYSNR